MLSQTAIRFLEARAIDVELADRLGLESCRMPGGGDDAIAIPFRVGGEVVNRKYRALDAKRFAQDKDATKCLWNFDAIVDPTLADQPLIVTEGEFDAMAAMQAGYSRVVSVPDGAPTEELGDRETRKYSYLDHARSALRDVREIVLATDDDGPGHALLNDLSRRLGVARCRWLKYPKGCKDLNDVLLAHGARGITETLNRAQWCRVDGLYRMSELPPYEYRKPYRTGFDFLDPHFNVRMGDFSVVTGVPGHGKTTWVNDLCCRLASRHDWCIAIASFEQHPQADHRRALREWYWRKPETAMDRREMFRADEWIDEHFVFIVPSEDDTPDLEWTLDKAAAAVVRYGARVVVIDPWNEMDHARPPDMSLTEYTGKAIKEFRRIARSLDAHVMVVAHPTKLASGEVPSLYSISDSAHWANKTDAGIVIWRDRDSEATLCNVVKSRYHDQIGKPGRKWMLYDPLTRRFEETDPREAPAAPARARSTSPAAT